MKKLILLLLFPVVLLSQFRGNISMTQNQVETLQERFIDPQNSFPLIVNGFSDEVGHINRGAAEFFLDISLLGAGNDRGGWYPAADMVVNGAGTNPFQPFGNNVTPARAIHNFHYAADQAAAENSKPKADLVFRELLFQATNPRLDFSNQTVFDRTQRSYINPVFLVAAKMSSYRTSYGLIHHLLEGNPYYEANKATVDNWLKEAADYFKAVVDNNITYWIITGDFYADNSVMTMRTSPVEDFFTHYDANGVGYNEVSDLQFALFNNRILQLVGYVGGYAMAYGDVAYQDWHYNYFKKTIQLGVFSDNVFHEMARGATQYTTFPQPRPEEGVEYTWESCYNLVKGAFEWAVLVEKGYETNKGKYLDYLTSTGTGQLISNYQDYGSTSGGQKGIFPMLNLLADLYDGTVQHYTDIDVLINPEEQTYSLVTAMANNYYQDDRLEDFYMFDTDAGFPPADPNDIAFAVAPSNFGIAVGQGASVAGIVPYGLMNDAFVYNIKLPDLPNAASLATDANGNIIAGTSGGGNFVSLEGNQNAIDTGSDLWQLEMDRNGISNYYQIVAGQTIMGAQRNTGTSAEFYANNTGNASIIVNDGTQKIFNFDNSYNSNNDVPTKADVDAAIAAIPAGGTIPDNSITSAKIANGTILEEDLSSAVVTKLNAAGGTSSSLVTSTNAGDVILQNGFNQRILRGTQTGAFADGVQSSFFQFGAGNAIFSGNNGAIAPRVGFSTSGGVVIGNSLFNALPAPTAMLDVLGTAKATQVRISSLPNATSLATDAQGNIIEGTAGNSFSEGVNTITQQTRIGENANTANITIEPATDRVFLYANSNNRLDMFGSVINLNALSGVGERMVTVGSSGQLSTQPIPTGGTGMTAAQITLEANRALPPLRINRTANISLGKASTTFVSGENIGRRTVNFNTAAINYTIIDDFDVDDVLLFMTSTADANLLPASGSSFLINGTPTPSGATLSGNYGRHAAVKVANNLWDIISDNAVAFTPAPSNLYQETSGANRGTGVGSFTGRAGGSVSSIADTDFVGGTAIQISNGGAQFGGAQILLSSTAVATWSGGTLTQLAPSTTYRVTFDYKNQFTGGNGVQQSYFAVRQNGVNTPEGGLTNSNTVSSFTFTFTTPAAVLDSGSNINIAANYVNNPFNGWVRIANLTITQL